MARKTVSENPLATMKITINFDPKVISPGSLQERIDLMMREVKSIRTRGVLAIQGYTVSTSPESFVYREDIGSATAESGHVVVDIPGVETVAETAVPTVSTSTVEE